MGRDGKTMTGWISDPGWVYSWDEATGLITSVAHTCKRNSAPVKALYSFGDAQWICLECGSRRGWIDIKRDEQMNHILKTDPEPFQALWDGRKTFEVRAEDDRRFAVGDRLQLREYDPTTNEYKRREIEATVAYILRGPAYGIPEGVVVMSLERFYRLLR